MKQTQWTLAVIVLAVMVFVVTFAMNYLGGTNRERPNDLPPPPTGSSLTFVEKRFPPTEGFALEREIHTRSHIDFWFINPGEKPVKVGLEMQTCTCTAVE